MGPQSKYLDHAWGDPVGVHVSFCGHDRGHELNIASPECCRILQFRAQEDRRKKEQ